MESLQFSASSSSLDVSLSSLDLDEEKTTFPKESSKSLLDSGPYENLTVPMLVTNTSNTTSSVHSSTGTTTNCVKSSENIETKQLGEPLISCHLWNKCLIGLPPQLFQLTQIQWLNISNNRLTTLPRELCSSLVNLKNLYASYNQISSIPMDIRFLHYLQELCLDHNQITSLPKELFWCTNITHLYLPYNRLYWLPKDIVCLSKLKVLSVSYNNLIALPKELAKLSLEQLHIRNNPFLNSFLEQIAPFTPAKSADVLAFLDTMTEATPNHKKTEEDNTSSEDSDEDDEDELLEWLKHLQLEAIHTKLLQAGIESIEDVHVLNESDLEFLEEIERNMLLQAIIKNNINSNNNRYNYYIYY